MTIQYSDCEISLNKQYSILMDVEWTRSKGLDGVASVCSNPVLRWAKTPMLGIGVESVIILFGNNICLCTSVNLAVKGDHVCVVAVCCHLYFSAAFSLLDACDRAGAGDV